jgi:hypothetical protein
MEALKRTTAEVLSVSPHDNQYEERISPPDCQREALMANKYTEQGRKRLHGETRE